MTNSTPSAGTGCGCPEYAAGAGFALSRRRILQAAALGTGFAATSALFDGAFRQVAYGAGAGTNVVVVLSLRGGCDGLSMVVPRGSQHDLLAQWRPATVVPEGTLLGTDPRFGLHPAFSPLLGMWNAGAFGAVHAVGLPAPNRSHFEAMAEIEEATPGSGNRTGWINRMVGLDSSGGPETAVQLGSAMLPRSLVGPAPALGVDGVADLQVPDLNDADRATMRASVTQMWAQDTSLFGDTVRSAVHTAEKFSALAEAADSDPSEVHTSAYPDGPLRDVLANTAALIRADLGTSMVTVDYGDWDMHAGLVNSDKDPTNGWMHDQVDHLAGSLKAFFTDLAGHASRVTVVTLSEFGRRVQENGDRGVDHGYGNVMLLLGAGVAGGAVHGAFPGLAAADLADGDLALGQDYRSVLWEVISHRFSDLSGSKSTVFPGLGAATVGAMT